MTCGGLLSGKARSTNNIIESKISGPLESKFINLSSDEAVSHSKEERFLTMDHEHKDFQMELPIGTVEIN